MLDLVKIEFLKQRHQKLNFVVYGVVSLYLALICYYVNDARGLFDSFPFVYKFSLSYLNFLILPLYCVSYTIQAFGVEYRYRIMNNLKLASANLMKTFWAKILYIEINALCIMLIHLYFGFLIRTTIPLFFDSQFVFIIKILLSLYE
ncbi:TPA: ABC transporter permease [Streptococcus pneumoniae]|nr:ABC transporter permease [Streptococcus pneumoniae]